MRAIRSATTDMPTLSLPGHAANLIGSGKIKFRGPY